MPSRNRSAKTCELASLAPNDTGSALFKNLSMTLYALPTRSGFALVGLAASIAVGPALTQNGTKKSRRRRRLEVDNREASNRVDRSHSMSMKMDGASNDRESLT